MGDIKHHAIAVTSGVDDLLKKAHDKAIEIFKDQTSEILQSTTNSYKSFFIAPDGSKEGWEESQIGNKKRATFVKWINNQADDDGGNSLSFCEFFYGEDNGYSKIENNN